MKRLLSTKKLSEDFKRRLLNHSFNLVELPFIEIRPMIIPKFNLVGDGIIFSSQNAINIALENKKIRKFISRKRLFCVGHKTAKILEENDQKVFKIAQNASDLANFIVKNHQNRVFLFFCGRLRIIDLEQILSTKDIKLQVVEVYDTILKPHNVQGHFDGIIFFSPSGVKGYAINNKFEDTHCFCIGKTTANSVKDFTTNYTVAKYPSESELFISISNYFRN